MGNCHNRPAPNDSRLLKPRRFTRAIGLLVVLVASCAHLPPLQTYGPPAGQGKESACGDVFPAARWRLVHSIETVIAGQSGGVVIGVTVVSPAEREVEAIIMTLEGLVMFHARSSGDSVDIRRAIAPFDSPRFARGLIDDVTLLFLAPAAVEKMSGISAGGYFTCRYVRKDASAVDIVPGPDGGWKLMEYDRRSKLRRKVTADSEGDCPGARLPCRIDLKAFQRPAYTLKMSLIEAERDTE